MDFSVKKEQISVQKLLVDDFDERPMDCDFVLPDYMPDIAAVLKCTMKPRIQSKQRSGDRMMVDGTAYIRVFYLDEMRKCVRCCEFSQPFTSTFLLKNVSEHSWEKITARTDYVNCRAVSPRRLDVHGSFTVKMKLYGLNSESILCDIQGEKLYSKTATVQYTVPSIYAEKNFSISETAELGAKLPPAECLVYADATALVQECRKMNGKAILKGHVAVQVLYCSDVMQGEVHRTCIQLPFGQLLDVEGLEEEWLCNVGAEVTSCDIHLNSNQNGENTLISASVKVCAFMDCCKEVQLQTVTDAYSCLCPLELSRCKADLERIVCMENRCEEVRQTVELPSEDTVALLDLWAEIMPAGIECREEEVVFSSRLMFCMLTKDREGTVCYYERMADHLLRLPIRCDRAEFDAAVHKCSFSATGDGRMELYAQLDLSYRCYCKDSADAISQVTCAEEAFTPRTAAMKVYYAQPGEEIWDIAKCCRTSPDFIVEENRLTGERLSHQTALLIPLC